MTETQPVNAPAPRYRYYVLIPHTHEPRLLLFSSGQNSGTAALSLPHFTRSRRYLWQDVDHINREILTQYALDVTTLRCLAIEDHYAEAGYIALVYALENHSPQWTPPQGAAWYSREQLATLNFASDDERAYVEAWLDYRSSDHPQRVDWYRQEWFWVARAWLLAYVMCIPEVTVEGFVQLRAWQRSALLKATPNFGDSIYFKAVPRVFAHELPLTAWLSEQFPDYFPVVLAVEPDRGWMLLMDHGRRSLETVQDIGMWEMALRVLGRLQVRLSEDHLDLYALGVPSQSLEEIADYLDTLLADEVGLRVGGQLDDDAIAQLHDQAPRIKALCAELAACGIPHSLEHGDFYPGQVLVQGDRVVFIDWSDASIAHPFFSYASLENFVVNEMPHFSEDTRARLQAAYLGPWRDYADDATLHRAITLARPLAALHTAVLYHRLILPGMEIRWEMENMLPFWLRVLLDEMQLIAATEQTAGDA